MTANWQPNSGCERLVVADSDSCFVLPTGSRQYRQDLGRNARALPVAAIIAIDDVALSQWRAVIGIRPNDDRHMWWSDAMGAAIDATGALCRSASYSACLPR